MKTLTVYVCEQCDAQYETPEQALACEAKKVALVQRGQIFRAGGEAVLLALADGKALGHKQSVRVVMFRDVHGNPVDSTWSQNLVLPDSSVIRDCPDSPARKRAEEFGLANGCIKR